MEFKIYESAVDRLKDSIAQNAKFNSGGISQTSGMINRY